MKLNYTTDTQEYRDLKICMPSERSLLYTNTILFHLYGVIKQAKLVTENTQSSTCLGSVSWDCLKRGMRKLSG